jgi:hypothetical protein
VPYNPVCSRPTGPTVLAEQSCFALPQKLLVSEAAPYALGG